MPDLAIAIQPLADAIRRVVRKKVVGSTLRTEGWGRVPLAIRERAFFSAAVENVRLLGAMQEKVRRSVAMEQEALATGKRAYVDRSSFIGDMRQALASEGVPLVEGEGKLTDITGRGRLGLIYDFQTRQAAEFARFRMAADPDVLDAYPAQELVREEEREVPRDWKARWAAAGGRFWRGRMIALKDDPIWSRISRFGTPFPPFDFGSGMGVDDVDRETAEALGLITPGQKARDPEAAFNDRVEASIAGVGPDGRAWLATALGDGADVTGQTVRLRSGGGR